MVQALDPIAIKNHADIFNDYFIGSISPIQLVMGSHGSGKTSYSLNLVRLCILSYLGCPLPVKHASLPLFNKIIVKMKREDELESLRSSFGNELVQISNCLESIKNGGDKKLVIVDNFCTSSSHEDALAHLLAFTTILLERKCLAFINTNDENHLTLTKHFSSVSCLYMQSSVVLGKQKHTFKASLANPHLIASLRDNKDNLIHQITSNPLIKAILDENYKLLKASLDEDEEQSNDQNLNEMLKMAKDYRTLVLFEPENAYKIADIKRIFEAASLVNPTLFD